MVNLNTIVHCTIGSNKKVAQNLLYHIKTNHMKIIITTIFAALVWPAFAQFQTGYQTNEARDMIALCNSFTFLKEEGTDKEIIPENYKRIYASLSMGMDNQFQVYEKGKLGVIVIRGSTSNPTSWMANIYASMIPAKGEISIGGTPRAYQFANDPNATVHSGYALATVIMANEVIQQIQTLNRKEIFDIYITGHSQGGSLSQMLRAYLENLPEGTIDSRNRFKTYAFAPPMIGDAVFANEYDRRFSQNKTSYTIVNPGDPVPLFPSGMSEDGGRNAMQMFSGGEPNDFRSMLMAFLFQTMNDSIAGFANQMGQNLLSTLSGSMGDIQMPAYAGHFKYNRTGNLVEIEPMDFPEITMKNETTGEMDVLPEPRMYQHKPYVYYQSIMKSHFPEEFKKLKRELPPGM